MALLHPVVLSSKTGRTGKHKVRIALAHNGQTRYIVTDIALDSIKEFRNGMVIRRPDADMLNTKIRKILQHYQTLINEMDFTECLSCTELIFQIKNAHKSKLRTLKSIFEEYMDSVTLAPGTIITYNNCWKQITNFFDENTIVDRINHGMILSFDKHLRHGLSTATAREYMIFLKILINYAIKCGYVNFKINPFVGYTFPRFKVRNAWLSVDEIKQIRDIKSNNMVICKCRDLFMLSYYLGGINMADLLQINFKNCHNIKYIRQKIKNRVSGNNYVEFTIPPEALEIINRYMDKNGYIAVTPSQRKSICKSFFRSSMPKLAQALGMERLIFYSARKSFCQHAFNLGISTTVIDYILGHSLEQSGKSLYSYIIVTPEMATNAVRKVLDNLK